MPLFIPQFGEFASNLENSWLSIWTFLLIKLKAFTTMETLTVKDFAAKVKSKKDLYEVVQRNGYHLPSLKSTLVTENYLINVMDGSYWCPKVEEIKLR